MTIREYIDNGWLLVPITPNTKSPHFPKWNLRENCISDPDQFPDNLGVGLAHAYSGTMALDIDDISSTVRYFESKDIDIESIIDSPHNIKIHSHFANRIKLLFSVTHPLPTKRILSEGKTVFEFRCATSSGLTVQDLLPPSIHPITNNPYEWIGDWRKLSALPDELLSIWLSLITPENTEQSIQPGEFKDVEDALKPISPDCSREEWINIGMAIHSGCVTNGIDLTVGFTLWNEWSRPSEKYPGERDILQQWKSFKSDAGITLGTLFHIASNYGYRKTCPVVENGIFPNLIDTSIRFNELQECDLFSEIPLPRMDLSLWPELLAVRSTEISNQMGCDPLVPLWAGLGAVCGAADAQIRLELMDGFQVPPILWLMTIGSPADKKTPGSTPMFEPLRKIELEDVPRFKQALVEWEFKEAAHAASRKAALDFSTTPEYLAGFSPPEIFQLPPQPVTSKITVSDITSQKLMRNAAERPRGLLCYLDEMSSWIKKMSDRNSSEDRGAWVVSYESRPYKMDRVGGGSIECENLAVSVFGNIQPSLFKKHLSNLSEDGLIQRFIPAILNSYENRVGNPVPKWMTRDAQWEGALRLIYSLPAQTYRLSEEGYSEYRDFQYWYEQRKRDERLYGSNDIFLTAFGKLEGTTGRLILLFHLIESPFQLRVSGDVVRRVIQIVKTYIIPAFRFAYCADDSSFDLWLRRHVIQWCGEVKSLTLRDIRRSARRQLEELPNWKSDQIILDGMAFLDQIGWVSLIREDKTRNGYEWSINPELLVTFKEFRKDVIRAKQSVRDAINRSKGTDIKVVGWTPDI